MTNNSLFIATSSFSVEDNYIFNLLKKKNIFFKTNPIKKKLNEKEILKYSNNFTHIIAGTENYNQKVLNHLPNLKYIFRLGSGTDNIDFNTIKKKKIKFNKSNITPEVAVAELIIGFSISILRNLNEQNNNMKKKIWKKQMGNLLHGKKFGIIGYGKVGKYLAKLVKAFGADLIINDKKKINNINQKSLNYLISNSDIISLNLNYNKRIILTKEKLKKLKKNCIIINTSRAELIDNEHLYKMLKNNKISVAALDVFNDEPYYGKFIKLKNVLLTPHIGGYAKEIRLSMEREAIDMIVKNYAI